MKRWLGMGVGLLAWATALPVMSQESASTAVTDMALKPLADTTAASSTAALPAASDLPASDLSPWGMYLAADWVVKSVMILLLLASIATWAVWLGKQCQLILARRRARQLLSRLVSANSFAEALLATAIGLVAAIPAVVIYNYFARAIGSYRAQLADISVALLILVSRDLDRQSAAHQGVNSSMLLRKTG